MTTHLSIVMPGTGVQIDCWTDDPEGMAESLRAGGAYVFEGGKPQPVRTEDVPQATYRRDWC